MQKSGKEEESNMINTSSKGSPEERQQRVIEIPGSAKIKQLRQSIKDDLGIKEKVSIKLFLNDADLVKKLKQ